MANDYEGFLFAAANDVRAIEALANISVETHSEVIAFHAQQAAEKIVKNVFIQHEEVAPKTHAVDELVGYAVERRWLSEDARDCLPAAAGLSQHAVLARYTQTPDIGRGEALQAIADYESIARRLESEGYDIVPLDLAVSYLHDEGEVESAED